MKIAIDVGTCGPDLNRLSEYCNKLGVKDLYVGCALIAGYDEDGFVKVEELAKFKRQVEDTGLSIALMGEWLKTESVLNAQARAKRVEQLGRTIDSLDECDIHTLLLFPVIEAHTDKDTNEGRWDKLIRFYGELIVHAEKAKVKIANHGHLTPQWLVWNYETMSRLLKEASSDYNGVTFCTGSYQLAGDDIYDVIGRFGKKIFFVHARDVIGTWESYDEVFFGNGVVDFARVVKRLNEIGYDGVIYPEHFPRIEWESHGEASTAYTVGYLKAVLG